MLEAAHVALGPMLRQGVIPLLNDPEVAPPIAYHWELAHPDERCLSPERAFVDRCLFSLTPHSSHMSHPILPIQHRFILRHRRAFVDRHFFLISS